jgi:hypothetical protein
MAGAFPPPGALGPIARAGVPRQRLIRALFNKVSIGGRSGIESCFSRRSGGDSLDAIALPLGPTMVTSAGKACAKPQPLVRFKRLPNTIRAGNISSNVNRLTSLNQRPNYFIGLWADWSSMREIPVGIRAHGCPRDIHVLGENADGLYTSRERNHFFVAARFERLNRGDLRWTPKTRQLVKVEPCP